MCPSDMVREGKLAYILKEGKYSKNIIFPFIQFDHVNDHLALCMYFYRAPDLSKGAKVSKAQLEIYMRIIKVMGAQNIPGWSCARDLESGGG